MVEVEAEDVENVVHLALVFIVDGERDGELVGCQFKRLDVWVVDRHLLCLHSLGKVLGKHQLQKETHDEDCHERASDDAAATSEERVVGLLLIVVELDWDAKAVPVADARSATRPFAFLIFLLHLLLPRYLDFKL